MTERPLPDELISGQLDDRLAADEREQLEALLRDSPDARGLLQDLRQQSHDLKQLPGYRLDPGFVARCLADPRTQEAFDRVDSSQPVVADRNHRGIRTAVAAIAALAALILVAAFLQMPQLHEGSFELSRLDRSSPAPQEVDADSENETELKESVSAAKQMPFADASIPTRAEPENPKVLSGRGREISEEKAQIADKDQVGPRRLPAGEPPDESGIPSPDAASAIDELSVVADSVTPGSGVSPAGQSGQLGLSGTTQSVDLPQAYLQVVEISYPEGPQRMEQFFAALKRNDITLQPLSLASLEFEPVPTVPTTDPVAGGGVGGATRGWGGGARAGDAYAGDVGNPPVTGQSIAGPPDSLPSASSGLFVVTTAPDKMAALVGELSLQAEITEYRLTRPVSNLSLDLRGNQQLASSSLVVDQKATSGQDSGLTDSSPTDSSPTDSSPRPPANMFSFPAPDDSRGIGAAIAAKQPDRQRAALSREAEVVQADLTRKATEPPGLALELQKKSEFGRGRSAAAVSESPVPANKVRLDLAERELQSLERYLARPNQHSEYRSFLLWIRNPERAQEQQQGDALPSNSSEPDDADQR